jgi:hypothetical protein
MFIDLVFEGGGVDFVDIPNSYPLEQSPLSGHNKICR